MSFTLIGPFSFGSKVSSSQFNALCTDVSLALDKSVAGDTISGAINFASGGSITFNQANSFSIPTANAGTISGLGAVSITGPEGITCDAQSAITSRTLKGVTSIVAGGISTTHAGGIAPNIAGGIQDGGIAGGIAATVTGGISAGVAGGIGDGGVSGGIAATVANGIASGVDGGIALSGSAGDYLQYLSSRTYVMSMMYPYAPVLGSGWTQSVSGLVGPGTAIQQFIPITRMFQGVINGALLTSITMTMSVAQAHSGLPANLPEFGASVINLIAGSPPPAAVSMYTGGSVQFTAGSGSAWYNGGGVRTLTLPINQNNGFGAQASYYITLTDENGANALANNVYWGFTLTFTGIGNNAQG